MPSNAEAVGAARQRAQQAAEKLIQLAEQHGRVLLAGHATFNYMIAKALLKQGWQGPSQPGWRHWQFGVYQHPL